MRIATARRLDATSAARAPGVALGRLATLSLLRELYLTPKPGLVDRANSGAHRDMDFGSFRASIAAIAPWFPVFYQRGLDASAVPAADVLPRIRGDGLACERAMFAATDGVNTHKGSVFSFGLLCAAAGRLHGRGDALEREALCAEVARIASGLVERELAAPRAARTAGERLFAQHGVAGARGEAQSGFATARAHGVAAYVRARAQGTTDEQAMHEALLQLMAHNMDTNLVSRGGMDGLGFVQAESRRLLASPNTPAGLRTAQLAAFDQALIARNLSPGGSADLLAVSWFLAHLDDPARDPCLFLP
jgi:triphosphoribosyl-dephospho-CoA synthase